MGFYARILIRKVIINNGDFMIQELNQQLKSMYLEPRNKLRVDVDYVLGRLENIVDESTEHECDHINGLNDIKGFDYINKEIEDFINELKQNMENHNGN